MVPAVPLPACPALLCPLIPLLMQPGGYFVNLGPLLYHWADAHTYLEGEELSVELSLEEVKAVAAQVRRWSSCVSTGRPA